MYRIDNEIHNIQLLESKYKISREMKLPRQLHVLLPMQVPPFSQAGEQVTKLE